MPTTQTASPTGRNSNIENGARPADFSRALAATFVEVPIRVQVPPSIEAKASGISTLPGLTRLLRQRPSTAGIITAVQVVLFMKDEMKHVTGMTASSTLLRLPPA